MAKSLARWWVRPESILAGLVIGFFGLCCLAFAVRMQIFTVSNGTGREVSVSEVALACDKIAVGALKPHDTKTFIFRRSCTGEATYVVTGIRSDGTHFRADACYIDKFPDVVWLRIVESTPSVKCEGSGLLDALLSIWRR